MTIDADRERARGRASDLALQDALAEIHSSRAAAPRPRRDWARVVLSATHSPEAFAGARYRLCNGADVVETTLDGFLDVNELEAHEIAALHELAPGETYHGDEGAGGTWTMTRLPDA